MKAARRPVSISINGAAGRIRYAGSLLDIKVFDAVGKDLRPGRRLFSRQNYLSGRSIAARQMPGASLHDNDWCAMLRDEARPRQWRSRAFRNNTLPIGRFAH